jgi:UDP-N-acetylglucosamine acyltransferase
MARLVQHVLPFTIAEGAPAKMRMVNNVSMERTGFSKDEVKVAKKSYKILFMRELKLEDAVVEIKEEFPKSDVAKSITDFIKEIEESGDVIKKRGLARK